MEQDGSQPADSGKLVFDDETIEVRKVSNKQGHSIQGQFKLNERRIVHKSGIIRQESIRGDELAEYFIFDRRKVGLQRIIKWDGSVHYTIFDIMGEIITQRSHDRFNNIIKPDIKKS